MRLGWWVFIGLARAPTIAWADPCNAPLPERAGATFSGPVSYEGDGDSLCVRTLAGQVEVRLADVDAPELRSPQGSLGRRHLVSVAHGRPAVCTVTPGRSGRTRSYDRVLAVCRIGGKPLGRLLRDRGAPEGGR